MTMIRGAKRKAALAALLTASVSLIGLPPAGAIAGVVQVSALTTGNGCSRLADATVVCSGLNDQGQLGNNTTSQSLSPIQVLNTTGTGNLTDVVQVVTGPNHTCARISDGTVDCWGGNTDGQLGDGTHSQRLLPVQVKDTDGIGALTGVTSVAVGFYHTCALLSGGTAVCWGDNSYYQIGDGTNTERLVPRPVRNGANSANLTSITQISAGQYDTCTVMGDHTARCWGTNNFGQLGNATTSPKVLPYPVRNGNNTANIKFVSSIAAGPEHTCALLNSSSIKGQVRCWGSNQFGQLGDGTNTQRLRPVPVKVVSGTGNLVNIVQISLSGGANGDHTCARTQGSTALCWGSNNYGQLGIGNKVAHTRPVVVRNSAGTASITGVVQLLAGMISTCAVIGGQQARCWGFNSSGQFGNGGAHDSLRPVAATP